MSDQLSLASLTALGEYVNTSELSPHPPVEQWRPQHHGQIAITILADGSWVHEGGVIHREGLVKLFTRILWFEDGQHYLKTPVEQLQIQVEDAPFFMTTLAVMDVGTPRQQLVFSSRYGEVVVAGSEHRLWLEADAQGNPLPYIGMRYGMRGKLSRSVFYQLAQHLESDSSDDPATEVDGTETAFWVRSQGILFPMTLPD